MKLTYPIIICLATVAACATYTQNTAEMHRSFRSKNYSGALRKLDETDLKSQDRNRLLYRMERAMILDRMGERKKSRALLMEADQLADELYTVSISRQAASFVVSESQTDYSGEDYEIVAIHSMLALSFIDEGDLNATRVEAKRINTKLAQLTQGRSKEHNSYHEDGFARYLAGLVYEARKEYDSAIVDYRKALKIFEAGGYRKFYAGPVPRGLITSLYRVAQMRNRATIVASIKKRYPNLVGAQAKAIENGKTARLAVIHEIGTIIRKRAKEFLFPFGKQVIRFSFPYIPAQRQFFGRTGVYVDGLFHKADNVADMNSIAHHSLEDRRGRMLAKNAARLVAKGQLTEEAHKQFGPLGGLIANVFSAATESADTRSWTLLPGAFFVTMVTLKPGAHEIRFQNNGVRSSKRSVNLQDNELLILRD